MARDQLNSTENFTDNGGPPGQTFTAIGATPTLTSFTFMGAGSNSGGVSSFSFQVGLVNADSTITQLSNDTVTLGGPAGASDFLTYTPTNPIPLTTGKLYEVSVFTGMGTFYGFSRSPGSTDVYTGGTAFNNDKTTGDAGNTAPVRTFNGTVSPRAYDYVFYVNATPTPEPGSLSVLGLGAMGLLARRRRLA